MAGHDLCPARGRFPCLRSNPARGDLARDPLQSALPSFVLYVAAVVAGLRALLPGPPRDGTGHMVAIVKLMLLAVPVGKSPRFNPISRIGSKVGVSSAKMSF